MSFTHLHVHTEYSLLDGAARIEKVIARAKELGMDSLAITDHGAMFGAIDFYKEALKQGIKPIIGCEVYTAARAARDKSPDRDKHSGHLLLLAENNQGYQNLIKIVSFGYTEGFYYKPRIDYDILRQYSKGIIALSGCLAGRVQQALLKDDFQGAKKEALTLREIFGPDNFFLEIQNQGLPEEYKIMPAMKRLHEETGIPFAATNDVHYVNIEDAESHDILLCIQTAALLEETDRMKFPNKEFYLKSEDEMRRLFPDLPDAIDNTGKIAERCNVSFQFGQLHLPGFQSPEGMDNPAFLRHLCESGCKNRYGEISEELRGRLEYELSIIESMGFVEYFLIVWDFINFAKTHGIVVGPGRGSGAGSLVAYCLRITDIDPIKYGLIFERFLNPERISMPDFDIDFCYERRQEVIEYVIEKYGSDKVAQIITFGTMKAKAAVRDVGRVLGMGYSEVDAIAKMIPFDLKMTIDKALKVNPQLKERYDNDNQVKKLIDTARDLEGMPRHVSTHAAGVVISKESIDEYVPLYLSEKGISTQFPMTTVEELGLLKMDFLGLRNLTVIRDALVLIKDRYHIDIDFSKMEHDDPKVYETIAMGNTLGIFQLESMGMTQFMKTLKPDCFEDIIAGISLYRPGPMDSIPKYIENKKNPSLIQYSHPSLKPILSVTYGCLVYQEQVMKIVRDLGGYSYGRSDLVRRAMGKKKVDVMKKEQEYFVYGKTLEDGIVEVPGCVRNGIPAGIANEIFDDMVKFAEYAFNKSHAAAYAVLAYETAWLKTYYPIEFMAALMTSVINDPGQIAKYIRNCRDMGIPVLPPDINSSEKNFSVVDGAIRFGLLGIKGVGEGVIDEIIRKRQGFGPFKDIFEFIDLVDIRQINKKAVESLIKAGAFDSVHANRAQYMSIYESLLESAQSDARKNISGQISFFEDFADTMESSRTRIQLPDVVNFQQSLILSMEKEMLGVYVSGHPLDEYAEQIKRMATTTTEEIQHAEDNPQLKDGMRVVICGMVASKKTMLTKKNTLMAFTTVEDLYGVCEVIVFPNVYEKSAELLEEDKVLVVRGTLNFKEDEAPKILANSIEDINESRGGLISDPVRLTIPARLDIKLTLTRLSEIFHRHNGQVPVIIKEEATGRRYKTDPSIWVKPTDQFYEELYRVIGKEQKK